MHALPVFPLQIGGLLVATAFFVIGGYLVDENARYVQLKKATWVGLSGILGSMVGMVFQQLARIGGWEATLTKLLPVFITVLQIGTLAAALFVIYKVFTDAEISRYPHVKLGAVTLVFSILTVLFSVLTTDPAQPVWLVGELSAGAAIFFLVVTGWTYADFDKEPIGGQL